MKPLRAGLLTLSCFVFLAGCGRDDPRLAGMQLIESGSEEPATIDELQAVIDEYAQVVNEKIQAGIRQAQYLKYLAHEYTRNEMYGLALEALEEALLLEPQNQVLHQLAGASAAYVAKAQGRSVLRNEYFTTAERHYMRAIELSPDYTEAHYALSVLYQYELGEPENALPHVERVLELSPNNVPALFVQANAQISLGDIDAAIEAYDAIIRYGDDREDRERAARNRRLILGGGE